MLIIKFLEKTFFTCKSLFTSLSHKILLKTQKNFLVDSVNRDTPTPLIANLKKKKVVTNDNFFCDICVNFGLVDC